MANVALAGSEMIVGIVQQAAWGTPEIDSVNYNSANNGAELQSEPIDIKNDLNVRSDPEANGARNKIAGNTLVDTNEAMPPISISNPTARPEFLDLLLASWFQKVVEDALIPFGKTFTIPVNGETMQPDFSSDAGFFFTVTDRHPTASRSRKLADCISQTLTIRSEPKSKISLTADMIGRGVVDPTSNPSGTWTRYNSVGYQYAGLDRQTIDFGAGPVSVALKGPWELVLNQTVSGEGQDAGQVENFALTARGGTFNIPIQDDANTMTAFANAAIGTAITVNLGYGNASPGTVDGDLDFSFRGILTEDIMRNKDGVMSAVLVGELEAADAATSLLTIIMANGIDRAW